MTVVTLTTFAKYQGTIVKAKAIMRRLYGEEVAERYKEQVALRAWNRHVELSDSVVKDLYGNILSDENSDAGKFLRSASETEDWM